MIKPRKKLTDSLDLSPQESAFIKGETPEQTTPRPEQTTPPTPASQVTKKGFMQQLKDKKTDKEPIVRITVDLSESVHHRLTMLCAKNRITKADLIRGLVEEALEQHLED